jgi:hypothetical protein
MSKYRVRYHFVMFFCIWYIDSVVANMYDFKQFQGFFSSYLSLLSVFCWHAEIGLRYLETPYGCPNRRSNPCATNLVLQHRIFDILQAVGYLISGVCYLVLYERIIGESSEL